MTGRPIVAVGSCSDAQSNPNAREIGRLPHCRASSRTARGGLYLSPMAVASPREPIAARQPADQTRAGRGGADVWRQIQDICRDAMTVGRTIATLDTGVANRILEVRPDAIARASGNARTLQGRAQVTRGMVERVWQALMSDGHASRMGDVLFFTYALVAGIPGVAVDGDRQGCALLTGTWR
jgi:hypothetical protein